MPNGQAFCEYIDDRLDILINAPATKFCATIKRNFIDREIHFLTHQPMHWRPKTAHWIFEHFPKSINIIHFVNSPQEKMAYLESNDLLIEDYPFFEDYSKIVLIDWPYNQNVKNPYKRISDLGDLRNIIYYM